jgi:hypothetical protein
MPTGIRSDDAANVPDTVVIASTEDDTEPEM